MGILVIAAIPKKEKSLIKVSAIGFSVATFIASAVMLATFEIGSSGMQFHEKLEWIPEWGISYNVGVDGISLFLVVLTTLLTPLALLSSWNSIKENIKGFLIAMLALETGMIGVFLALPEA